MTSVLHIFVFVWTFLFVSTPVTSETPSSIPEILQPCYRTNFSVISRPPLTMPVLIEMLRKIELNEKYSINTRLFSTSMLHGVVFDGVQKSPGLWLDNTLAIPYAATLNKFHKFKVIVDYLISGRISLFPSETLTLDELCFLHRLTSNTVDRFERGDEASTCEDLSLMPRPAQRLELRGSDGSIHQTWLFCACNRAFACIYDRNECSICQWVWNATCLSPAP